MQRILTHDERTRLLETWKREGGLSGNALKTIACAIMFLDHLSQGVALRSIGFQVGDLFGFWHQGTPVILATLGTLIGRIAFPIFCFFLVQGILLTRDWKKQVLRLLLFGLVSEIPFNLDLNGTLLYPGHQNVMFTLATGAITIALMEWARKEAATRWKKQLAGVIFVGFAILAQLLKFDYGAAGIIAMVLFYLAAHSRYKTLGAGIFAFLFEAPLYGVVYLSLPLIYLYNGSRGRGWRYAFYLFYPGHLLFLYLLSLWI